MISRCSSMSAAAKAPPSMWSPPSTPTSRASTMTFSMSSPRHHRSQVLHQFISIVTK
ncbi:hypothetical protein GW17_00031357 [Ensete ventricosum]|nr:hypothetical protein GW17_00031357 [Ensete ventricosum]